jgi:serine/threonine-protein kinase
LKLWQFIILLASAVMLLGVALLGFNFLIMPRLIHRHTAVPAPDLRGLTVSEAIITARESGLGLIESRQRSHPTVARGLVLDQTPEPATSIRRGRVVEVVTSSGPPAGLVPDLRGLTRRQAEITLQREAFSQGRLARVRRADVTVPTVVYQYPPPGVTARKGMAVSLVVAEPAAQPIFRMPDFRGASLFVVREAIAAAGCVAAPVVYERTSRYPPNTVLDQEPSPGERIRKGDRVELVASSR